MDATIAIIDQMVADTRHLANGTTNTDARLTGLRKLLHEAGPWNDHRPFAYNHSDPLGQSIDNKLITTYLDTFGLASDRFDNNYFRGGAGQGSWNYGPVRLGWSFNSRTGNVYFQPRIGNYHVPSPIYISAPPGP